MALLIRWTDPSPKRNCTPAVWPLDMASASVTMLSLGRCGPQWPSTSAEPPEKSPGERTDGTWAPVGTPAQADTDIVVQRSPTKKVLLRPSVTSAVRKPRVPRTKAPVCGGVELSSTPSLPLQAT